MHSNIIYAIGGDQPVTLLTIPLGHEQQQHLNPSFLACRRRYKEQLATLFSSSIHWVRQVHGIRLTRPNNSLFPSEADGLISQTPNQVCAISCGDCLPIAVYSRDGGWACIMHAGWKGLYLGIIQESIMASPVPVSRLNAWIGPGICGHHYEVGTDFMNNFCQKDENFEPFFNTNGTTKPKLDLKSLARYQLLSQGVSTVVVSEHCTYCDHRFYSYRRQGKSLYGGNTNILMINN
ncbi:MAG: peptidoglycan editing factor PgeF [Pseudomonadota bacterium]|nr:peptidoglycan editing factor PgeF [Pseudomonadota bacterium]